jgi:hypothetical protein
MDNIFMQNERLANGYSRTAALLMRKLHQIMRAQKYYPQHIQDSFILAT